MRQAQTLAKMLTAQDPDPQAILTLLRETLVNRPKTEVYDFVMSYDHLRNQPKSGESGSAGFSRTAILDDLNDAFRRKENADAANRVPHDFADTDESWADIAAEKEPSGCLAVASPRQLVN